MKFLNCQIDVSKKIFRPRPETSFWVGEAIKKIKKQKTENKELKILDIFAGSGCIGIAVLRNISNAKIDFIDFSGVAIEQIEINSKLNKIPQNRYRIIQSNMFERLEGNKYDYIFANPPYVALDRIGEVQKEVLKNDPALALFAGKDGVVIIDKFLSQVEKYLKPGGRIFMEFDPFQKTKIKNILEREKLFGKFEKDQFGKMRWVEAKT